MGQHQGRGHPEGRLQLPAAARLPQAPGAEHGGNALPIGVRSVVPGIDQQGQAAAHCQGRQPAGKCRRLHVIAIQQQIPQHQGQMVPHPHIVAAQHQDHQQTQAMDSQFPAQLRQVGQPGAKGQHQKHKTQGQQALAPPHAQVRLPEHHQAEQNHHAHNVVLRPKHPAVQGDKGHTEHHGQQNLHQIYQQVPGLGPPSHRLLDHQLGARLIELQFLIKGHPSPSSFENRPMIAYLPPKGNASAPPVWSLRTGEV